MDTTMTSPASPPPPSSPPQRRWLRWLLAIVALLVLLLAAAVWFLGRETTLQQIVQRVANASGGQVGASGVSGSLYGRMHVDRIVHRTPDSVLTLDDVTIAWSPLQYFSEGIAISELHVARAVKQTLRVTPPPVMPTSLALPFKLGIRDARVGRLDLQAVDHSIVTISAVRFQLDGDAQRWRITDASALTAFGKVDASGALDARAPFALKAKAGLTQTSGIAAGAKSAQLSLDAGGNLALVQLALRGAAGQSGAQGTLAIAPFAAFPLRAMDIKGSGIDPVQFNPAWPQAKLDLHLQTAITPDHHLSGALALDNRVPAGPLDQQRLPLQSARATLGGTLTATTLSDVLLDLGAAGRFEGGGRVQRTTADAGIDAAQFELRTGRLDLHGVHSAARPTALAGAITLGSAQGSYPGQTLGVDLAQTGLRLQAQALLNGALLRVKQARITAGKGHVNATLAAHLDGQRAFEADAALVRFDPSALSGSGGSAVLAGSELNGVLTASGRLSPAWQVDAAYRLDGSRWLGQPLAGNGKLHADTVHMSGIELRLALGPNTLEARGAFGAPGEQLAWKVDGRQLSAALPGVPSGLLGMVAASGVASGSYAAPRTTFAVEAKGLGLQSAKHPAPDSVLQLGGDVQYGAGLQVIARGSVQRMDPAAFGRLGAGSMNATLAASFNGNTRKGALDLALQPSTYAGAPLSGYVKAQVEPLPGKDGSMRMVDADADLRLGPNSARLQGAFGAPGDRLDWNTNAPQLATLGPGFGGVVRGAGVLSGTQARPALALHLEGANLRLPGEQQLKSLKANASVGMGSGGADPVTASVIVTGYTSPGLTLQQASLSSTGTRAAHVLQLAAANADFDASVKVRGGVRDAARDDGWDGVIESLQNKGRFALALQTPATVRLGFANTEGKLALRQASLTDAVLRLADGALRIDYLEKNGARWRSKGAATGVPASYLAQLSAVWRENVVSDLVLGAAWALEVQAPAAPGGAPALDGNLQIVRERGDVTVRGADQPAPVALDLRKLEARASVANGALRMQLDLDGARAGQARLDSTVQLVQGRIAHQSALTLSGEANLGSIAWLAPLTGMQGLELDGALKLAMRGSGVFGEPVLQGDLSGERLVVNWSTQGIRLRNGQLAASLAGDRLQLQRLAFEGDGGRGSAQADGWLRFANAETTMQLKLVADHLQVLSRPDRTLVVSGQTTLLRDAKHFQLDGKLKAERASIELAAEHTPTISEDVVVLGRGKGGAALATAAASSSPDKSLPLNVDVEADLGDDFRLQVKGLDAQLNGTVRVRIQDRRAPRVTGSIRVASGTYAAYGQRLSVERGVLNFTGAYDNPGLNILAVRKRPEGEQLSDTNVEAGVEVRGTALAPLAKLVSTPVVPDSDKLAWLVLGHGLQEAGGNEMALLGTAAGALFGGTGSGIAGKLGLDELGFGQAQGASSQAKGLESTVVTVGKRLSSRAYLSFEQGAGTATSLVKLRYKLNPRITLQFQTGTNNALDVLYTWAFD